MHAQRSDIRTGQLFTLLFVAQAAPAILLSDRSTGGSDPLQGILSVGLTAAAGLVLTLPVLLLRRKTPALASRGPFALLPVVYIAGTVWLDGAFLGLFQVFLQDTVNPDFSARMTVTLLVLCAAYGALRGLECVARCAGVIFAFLRVGTGLVLGITATRMDPGNLPPPFYDGCGQTLRGTGLFLSRLSFLPALAVLFPRAKGGAARPLLGFAGGLAALYALILLLLGGCLGPYAGTQNFPVYALATLTEVRSMQRLDAVFVGVWFLVVTARIALGLTVCRACGQSLAGDRGAVGWVLGPAAGLLLVTLLVSEVRPVREVLLAPGPQLAILLLLGAGVPLGRLGRLRRAERSAP